MPGLLKRGYYGYRHGETYCHQPGFCQAGIGKAGTDFPCGRIFARFPAHEYCKPGRARNEEVIAEHMAHQVPGNTGRCGAILEGISARRSRAPMGFRRSHYRKPDNCHEENVTQSECAGGAVVPDPIAEPAAARMNAAFDPPVFTPFMPFFHPVFFHDGCLFLRLVCVPSGWNPVRKMR